MLSDLIIPRVIFFSLYWLVLTFPIKLKTANCKHYWDVLVFHDQWKIISDLNKFPRNMSDFVSIPLLGFTLIIKLRNFAYENHWNILIFFDYGVRFKYVPEENVWFCFHCLRLTLAINWEISILKTIKIV